MGSDTVRAQQGGRRVRRTPGTSTAPPVHGRRQLTSTIRDIRGKPHISVSPLAHLVHNDGILTVISQASVHGSRELGPSQSTLITAVLTVQVPAVTGALGRGRPGPLLFGITHQPTGSHRNAIISLVAFFLTGFTLLARVPVRRAITDADNPAPDRI